MSVDSSRGLFHIKHMVFSVCKAALEIYQSSKRLSFKTNPLSKEHLNGVFDNSAARPHPYYCHSVSLLFTSRLAFGSKQQSAKHKSELTEFVKGKYRVSLNLSCFWHTAKLFNIGKNLALHCVCFRTQVCVFVIITFWRAISSDFVRRLLSRYSKNTFNIPKKND